MSATRLGPAPDPETDLILAVLIAITPPGYCWTESDLAEMLGYDHERVSQIEQGALKKLRTRTAKVPAIMQEQGLTYDQCRPTSPRHLRSS